MIKAKQMCGGSVVDRGMARVQRSFRMVTAALFMLVALVLFGAPSTAQAAPVSLEPGTGYNARITVVIAGLGVGTESLWAAPAPAVNDGGCGQHSGASSSSGCCTKTKCPLTHSGIAPVSPLPAPSPEASVVLLPSGFLSEGIGTLPNLRPPRASV